MFLTCATIWHSLISLLNYSVILIIYYFLVKVKYYYDSVLLFCDNVMLNLF